MHKILVVEDNTELQLLIKGSLGPAFQAIAASTITEAIKILQKTLIDLALIDIGLPDGDGFHLCSQLKNSDKTAHIPVIFLTSKNQLQDKLMGFSLGAEDYIVKPFEPLELRARITAKLKHNQASDKNQILRKGSITLHPPYMKCFVGLAQNQDQELPLTPNEFRLLYHFMTHENHVLSRIQLLDAIWGSSSIVNDRTVDATIYSLRKKLGEHAVTIESVFGAGYRFTSQGSCPQSQTMISTDQL